MRECGRDPAVSKRFGSCERLVGVMLKRLGVRCEECNLRSSEEGAGSIREYV
jgi:hypothetical protein